MNRIERNRLAVGLTILSIIAVAGYFLFAWGGEKADGEYALITTLPRNPGLAKGVPVVMDGKVVGEAQKVSIAPGDDLVSVRLTVERSAFRRIGADSVAWVEKAESGPGLRVALKAGRADSSGQFTKIKPVRGLEAPP